mmetsp:Transcript_22968/g.50492  ORF Transcript_22968/g.50492 Transcript_22968/m.50492 type:complete len:317 (-) Transcript_22968:3-953(-)
MLQRLLGRATLRGILSKHRTDQVLGLVAHTIPFGVRKVKLACFDHLEDCAVVIPIKRRGPAEQHVHDNAEGPHITLLIVLAAQYLWCHVVWSTCLGLHDGGLSVAECASQAEINNLHRNLFNVGTLALEQEILRLEIAVGNTMPMAVPDGADNLAHDYVGLLLGEVLQLNDLVKQFATDTLFHDQVVELGVMESFHQPNNGRVIHLLHDLDLGDAPLEVSLYFLWITGPTLRAFRHGLHSILHLLSLARFADNSIHGTISSLTQFAALLLDVIIVPVVSSAGLMPEHSSQLLAVKSCHGPRMGGCDDGPGLPITLT